MPDLPSPSTHANTSVRLLGLDILRGINIVAMVIYHFILPYFPQPSTSYAQAIHFMGSLVAPLFFFLSGSGVRFFFEKHKPFELFKRGLFLFLIAFAVSIVFKRRFYLDWNLIEDIGLAFIIMSFIAWAKTYKFWLATAIYLILFVLFVIFNFKIDGVFPIYPMAIYFLLGYGFALLCPLRNSANDQSRNIAITTLVILGTTILGVLSLLVFKETRFEWYSSSLIKNGFFMSLYFMCVYWFGNIKFEDVISRFVIRIGRLSLTLYYIQQALLIGLLGINFHFIVINPVVSSLLLTAFVFLFFNILLKFWEPLKYKLSLEWWMRRI